MTGSNAEIVQRLMHLLWQERDVDAAKELLDPEGGADLTASRAPYSGKYRGHADLVRFFESTTDAWDEFIWELEEAIDVDPETVLTVAHIRARGKGSGVPVEAHGASVWSVREGRITGVKLFQSKPEALEALGLPDPH